MPKCEGLPNGPCLNGTKDNTVKFGPGELFLCPACVRSRFPENTEVLKVHSSSTSSPLSQKGQDSEHSTTQEVKDNGDRQEAPVIIQPLLAYMQFSLQSGTQDNVKAAVLGHFTADQILDAKIALWDGSAMDIIGPMARRKDSTVRSEKEAHCQDILIALSKLDKADCLPTIAIDALSLGIIPRSHPEELNNISLVDRLNRMEAKLTKMQELLDRTVAENLVIKEKIEYRPDYASVVVNGKPNGGVTASETPTIVITKPLATEASTGTQHPNDKSRTTYASPVAPSLRGGGHNRGRGGASGRGGPSARPMLPNGGRGGIGGSRGIGNPHHLSLGASLDRLSDHPFDYSRDRSMDSDDFTLPYYAVKQNKKRQNRRQKVITGKGPRQTGSFKGAPEPGRSLFVHRVDSDTEVKDLERHLRDLDIDIMELECVSHPEAHFKSFKLTVPVSQMNDLLTDDIWPTGVRVRRFFAPRRGDQQQGLA